MKTRWPVTVNSVKDLESLNDRVRFAIETATRTQIDPSISRKVTSRIIGEKDWKKAIDSVGHRQSVEDNVSTIRHYLKEGLPSYLRMYNLYQYLTEHQHCEAVEREIDHSVKKIFGRKKTHLLTQRAVTPLDYLYLIHKVDRKESQKIVGKANVPKNLQSIFRWKNFCRWCLQRMTPFNRCLNHSCKEFLECDSEAIMALPKLSYFPMKIAQSNSNTIVVDIAPAVESLAINTNKIYGIEYVFDKKGRLKEPFHGVIGDIYGICNIASVSLRRSSYRRWIKAEKLKLKQVIGLPDIA